MRCVYLSLLMAATSLLTLKRSRLRCQCWARQAQCRRDRISPSSVHCNLPA